MADGQKFQVVFKDVVDSCIFGLTRQFFSSGLRDNTTRKTWRMQSGQSKHGVLTGAQQVVVG